MTRIFDTWFRLTVALTPSSLWGSKSFSVADQIVVSAANFLTGVIIGRTCSPGVLGLYMLGLSMLLVAVELQTSLICSPYMVYSPYLRGASRCLYAGSSVIHQLVLSGVVAATFCVAAWMVFRGIGPTGLSAVIWSLAASTPLILLREFARRVCFADFKFRAALLLDFLAATVQITALLVLARLDLLSASAAFLVAGMASGLAGIAWLIFMRGRLRFGTAQAVLDLKRNFRFARWIFASGILWAAIMNFYPWVLAYFHGTESAGVWAACFGVVSIGNPLLFGVQNFLGPRLAHGYAQDGIAAFRRLVWRATFGFAILILPFTAILMAIGGKLVGLVYGSQYEGNGLVVCVLGFSLLATTADFTCSRALFAMKRADVDFAVNTVALIILAMLGVWLVAVLGPLGVACSMLITNVSVSGMRLTALILLSRSASSPASAS